MAVDKLIKINDYIDTLREVLDRAHKAHMTLVGFEEFRKKKPRKGNERDLRTFLVAYRDEFSIITNSLSLDVSIQLAKILIPSRNSLNIETLLKYVKAQEDEIDKSKEQDWFETELENIALWAEKLEARDILEVQNIFQDNDDLITKLGRVRNHQDAHLDKGRRNYDSLSLKEQKKLINISKRLIDIVSFNYGTHHKNWHSIEHDTKIQTIFMLEKLYSTY